MVYSSQYAVLDVVKQKLRVSDATIDDELMTYMSEVDNFINNALRRRLGFKNRNGDQVVLPLTPATIPALDEELKQMANDLVEGKFRFKTTENPTLWTDSQRRFIDYLDYKYGWTREVGYFTNPTLTVTPTTGSAGATVTLAGTEFKGNSKINIKYAGESQTTSPTNVTTNSLGSFSGVTFTVPTTAVSGTVSEITVYDQTWVDASSGGSSINTGRQRPSNYVRANFIVS